ncbi:MAG: His-Xaa-Ser system radical SAM maturase HxsC [Candidatus Acidiferrales bacterium]
MLKLGGRIDPIQQATGVPSSLYVITSDAGLPLPIRGRFALLTDRPQDVTGYGVQLISGHLNESSKPLRTGNIYILPTHFSYLANGDIVHLDGARNYLQTLFRKNSFNNSILLTEQCNHYCLMCSQPPKQIEDSHLLRRAFNLISLMPKDARRIAFTGGEPTLYGDRLIDLVRHAKLQLPHTSVDLLSNGRKFKDKDYARRFAKVDHPSCTVAIPVYSDDPVRHDYVVQADGAFDETIQGILNLKRFGQRVEVRIVLHKQTIGRLVQTCEFLCRNLLFVDHVALMGLEITGFTRANLELLWIDPYEYKETLSQAIAVLNAYGIRASVYNHQLCVVNADVEGNYRKSISDWKNEYLECCGSCGRRSECGGFFSSSKMYRYSDHIKPF